jgi:putative inorganic carbon (HCO3(-)) transporter
MSPIRDLLLVGVLLPLVPLCFLRPWVGILAWYWVAYFVPHSFTWGFGRSLPVAMLVGGATLLGLLMGRDRRAPLPMSWNVIFLALFAADVTMSTVLAFSPEEAWEKWDWVIKSLLMTFVTMVLFQDRERLRWLYVVTALSLGLHGLKGGLWVLRTGGTNRVYGPDRSFFWDNNTLGLALCMILPLLLYLAREEPRPWLKRSMRVIFGFSVIAILFTYSRGAFIGLLVVVTPLVWRSPWRVRFLTAALIVGIVGAAVVPETLKDRIYSIAEQDSAETRDISTTGRLDAWHTASQIAIAHPLFGQGFRALWSRDVWAEYYGQNFTAARDAHSIYFEVLAEHGILGFAIYLIILVSTLFTLRRVRRRWRGDPEHGYLATYAEMTTKALYPFVVAGAFLGVAYFDLYFLFVATSGILGALSARAEAGAVTTALAVTASTPARRFAQLRASARAEEGA